MNGLILRLEDFKALPNDQKLNVLFENQQRTIKLIEGYKLNQKINNWIMGILSAGMAGLWGIIILK